MDRRQFLATTAAAAISRSAAGTAQTGTVPAISSARTSVLDIGYHESGPASGFPVFLLHGFPDDAHAYDVVAPALAAAGFRAFAIYLRGYGPTRFLDPSAPRTAQQSAIAQDVIDLADALKLPRIAVCGYDWGGRAACIAAALHPDRVRAAVLCGGYSIQNTLTPGPPAAPRAVRNGWYQWYLNTEVGKQGLDKNRRALCRFMWEEWSPTWRFTDAMYELTAASFDNPDFVDCVVHSYRHRNFNAPGERGSPTPNGAWRRDPRSKSRPSCCTAMMTASAGRRRRRQRSSVSCFRGSSAAGCCPASATSCRTKDPGR